MTRDQSHGYLPSCTASLPCDRRQIILFGDNRGTCMCKQLARGCYLAAARPGVELTTVRRPNDDTAGEDGGGKR